MDEHLLQRLALEFADHDDIQALITAARARAWEARWLHTMEREVAQAEAVLAALQIPEGLPAGHEWHRLSLAERIGVLHQRMLHHLHQAEAATADQGHVMVVQIADAPHVAGEPAADKLAEVHAVLDEYGVPRVLFSVLGPDWRAQDVPASAAERLRKLHRLMVESGLPDFMPPGTVVEG